jgi:transposase-like protein
MAAKNQGNKFGGEQMGKYNNDMKLDAQGMYARGQSFAEIARIIGCDRKTVDAWSKKYGWKSSPFQANPEPDEFAAKLASSHTYIKVKMLSDFYANMLRSNCRFFEETDDVRKRQEARLVTQACKSILSQQQALAHTEFLIWLAIILQKKITNKTLLRDLQDELIEVYDNYNHNRINRPA